MSLLPRAAVRLDGFLAIAREQLTAAQVAHFDETGGRVGGELHWIHGACTDTGTLFHLNTKRGRIAMDAVGVLPPSAHIAVHDGLVVYRQYDQLAHGRCNADHLRELAGIAEVTGQEWPTALAELLVELHVRGPDREGQRSHRLASAPIGHVCPALRCSDRPGQETQSTTCTDR